MVSLLWLSKFWSFNLICVYSRLYHFRYHPDNRNVRTEFRSFVLLQEGLFCMFGFRQLTCLLFSLLSSLTNICCKHAFYLSLTHRITRYSLIKLAMKLEFIN